MNNVGKVAYFAGELGVVLKGYSYTDKEGSVVNFDVNREPFEKIGLSDYSKDVILTKRDGVGDVAFIRIVGDFDITKCTVALTPEEADNILDTECYKDSYTVYDNKLYDMSLDAQIKAGKVSLANVTPAMSSNETYKYFYDNGVCGISKTRPNKFFARIE